MPKCTQSVLANFCIASAVSHQDNLEFLEDIVPKTVPFKKIKASAFATQAKLRGDKMTSEDGLQATLDASTTNGTAAAPAATNGEGSTFSVPLRNDDRPDDPNEQLELEMRQAAHTQDDDVEMRG